MILTTLIILILIGCFINGHRRGLLMMALYTGTYLVSWMTVLKAVDNNAFFYNGIAFLVIFTLVSTLCHWGIGKLRWIKRLPIIGTFDRLAGGILFLIIGYVVIYVALVVLQLWPDGWWQMQLANSGLAQFMINQTPALAQLVINTLK